jgi:CubicO group peptidase (beta-lactamase class C family)
LLVRDDPSSAADPVLATRLHDVAKVIAGRLAVAVVDLGAEDPVRFALVRAAADTLFEIGSITKGLTGMALADAVSEGRLSLDTRVGDVVPTSEGTDLASVTLLELATHTSGLPRMPAGGMGPTWAFPLTLLGRNPYRHAPMSVIELASRQRLEGRGHRRYSNLGGAVAGEVVATAMATRYPTLLAERIFGPVGMKASAVSSDAQCAPWGRSSLGLPREPWVIRGYAPAGGVVSTIDDMARLATGLLDGSAPGLAATYPIEGIPTDIPNRRTALFWIIDDPPSQTPTITWHNGGTGGYSSFLALMPEAGRAVIALQSVAGRSQRLRRIALDLATGK